MSSHLSPKGLEMGWGCLSSQFGVEVGVEADENENNSSSSSVSNPVSLSVHVLPIPYLLDSSSLCHSPA